MPWPIDEDSGIVRVMVAQQRPLSDPTLRLLGDPSLIRTATFHNLVSRLAVNAAGAFLAATLVSSCSSRSGNDGHGESDAQTSSAPQGLDALSDSPPLDTASGSDGCPFVSAIVADPRQVPVGGEIDVSVTVAPADAGSLSYGWTATSGQFENVIVRKTRFACTVPGLATVTVQVVGGKDLDGATCVQERSTTVECDVAGEASSPFVCAGSTAGYCTPTEQAFVNYDPSGACYACLLAGGCVDNTAGGDGSAGTTGNECDDLTGDAAGGPNAGAWKPSLCAMTINCILQTSCAASSVYDCYCGNGGGSACADSGSAAGPCLSTENAGLETTDAATALGSAFESKSLAAGVANAIFSCAAAHHCATCLGHSSGGSDATGPNDSGPND